MLPKNLAVNDHLMAATGRLVAARTNLTNVAARIARLLDESRSGRVGFITREWGFMTPHGLGGPIGGKFRPWEETLAAVKTFFPDPEAFRVFDEDATATRLPEAALGPRQHEMLPRHSHLHEYLRLPPVDSPQLTPQDIADYRDASRIFILLGSLAHLSFNSGADGHPVPEWIAHPFQAVASRLEVEPALTGHFLVVDNWQWRPDAASHAFGADDIELLYPSFGHSHERTYHTIPACMAYALRALPHTILDLLCAMRDYADERLSGKAGSVPRRQLIELIYELTRGLVQSKDEFQRISTLASHRYHVSKHVFIRHMQPIHKGIALRSADGSVRVTKGMSGLQFVSYHILDAVLGRYHHGRLGALAGIEDVDAYYPGPQRDYSACVRSLSRDATLRGFLEVAGADAGLCHAFNQLIECYAGESGVLAAHSRKLFSYMHNTLQVDTSAEGSGQKLAAAPSPELNHTTAMRMFGIMNEAVHERRRLRISPLYAPVTKTVAHLNEEGSVVIVDFERVDEPLHYHGSDIVRVLMPRDEASSAELRRRFFADVTLLTPGQLVELPDTGWSWADLWRALGWPEAGVSPELLCDFVEAVHGGDEGQDRPVFQPVSPRIYSVCGVTPGRLRVLVSRPMDNCVHFGFSRLSDKNAPQAFLACASGIRFRVPPAGSNLLMVASGTGISPFVSLAAEISNRPGRFTLVHQVRSPDLFFANLEAWKQFTRANPAAMVLGYVSGHAGQQSKPQHVVIAGGEVLQHTDLDTEADAYYFLSEFLLQRLRSVTLPQGNFAYCCGGVRSVVTPLRQLLSRQGWAYEFEVQSYGVERRISRRSEHFQVGNNLVDATQLAAVHPGGTQILDQMMRLAAPSGSSAAASEAVPDLSALFFELHPDAYNLLRLMKSPCDNEFRSFATFIDSEAERGVVLAGAADQYVAAALAFPDKLRVVKIALRLESAALDAHLIAGDKSTATTVAAAAKCLLHLEELFTHLAADDPDRQKFAQEIARAHERLDAGSFVFDAQTGARGAAAQTPAVIEVHERAVGGVLVLTLNGRLDTSNSKVFLTVWQAAQQRNCERFVLDLSGITFISSMGLRVLIVAAKQSTLVVCGMSPFVAQIFHLGGMGRVITVKDSVDEAVQAAG